MNRSKQEGRELASSDPSNQDFETRPEPTLSKWGLDEGDLGLIRWMLAMTPLERLRTAEGFAESLWLVKNGRQA